MELDLLGRVRQVSLSQRVGQQTCKALQYKVKILQMEVQNVEPWMDSQGISLPFIKIVSIPPLCESLTNNSQTGFQGLSPAQR